MKHILCATDGSHSAMKAVDFAVELAKSVNARLTFIHVIRPTSEDISHSYFWDSSILDAADAQIQQELREAMVRATSQGVDEVFCITASGHDIAKAIVDYAEKNEHDHVVTGSVGRSGIAKVLLGSIAQHIVQRSHCPVTIVR